TAGHASTTSDAPGAVWASPAEVGVGDRHAGFAVVHRGVRRLEGLGLAPLFGYLLEEPIGRRQEGRLDGAHHALRLPVVRGELRLPVREMGPRLRLEEARFRDWQGVGED